MDFRIALCISIGAAIGALAFAFCLLKLLIFYESYMRLQWANMIRERRETSERLRAIVLSELRGIGERPNDSLAVSAKAKTVCITDPTVQIAIARAPRPAWPESAEAPDAEPDAWIVVIQPSENESA